MRVSNQNLQLEDFGMAVCLIDRRSAFWLF